MKVAIMYGSHLEGVTHCGLLCSYVTKQAFVKGRSKTILRLIVKASDQTTINGGG